MKNIGFIGAFDKLDLLLYIAKILTLVGKKTIVIDATKEQKSRYIVPVINPTKSYITRFGDIDIAIGFESYEEIERYRGATENKKTKYDYALIDIGSSEAFGKFNNENTIKTYFTTSFDLYSIRKGLETISNIKSPIEITRILFSSNMNEEDNYYLEYLSLGYKTKWNDKIISFPFETNNLEVMIENQKTNKIKIKNLTQTYKDCLEYLITDIVPDINISNLRRIIKNLEKEG